MGCRYRPEPLIELTPDCPHLENQPLARRVHQEKSRSLLSASFFTVLSSASYSLWRPLFRGHRLRETGQIETLSSTSPIVLLPCVGASRVDTTMFFFRIYIIRIIIYDMKTKQPRDLFRITVQQPIPSP
jgi:hypothetical protein